MSDPTHSVRPTPEDDFDEDFAVFDGWGGDDADREGWYSRREAWRDPLAVLAAVLLAVVVGGTVLTVGLGMVASVRSSASPELHEALKDGR